MCEAKYDFLTVRDSQRTVKIGTNVAYNLIHSKAFPVIKIGKNYRIPAEGFYAWLESAGVAKQ